MRAKIIADSRCATRITTFELEYPRFIHSELMTHRAFSRNAASSRAIPMWKVIRQVLFTPAMPIHWGHNKKGMQADRELGLIRKPLAKVLWVGAGITAAVFATGMRLVGLHKQVGNRILEPWQQMKTVVTATEWDNFYTLRDHPDAQPEIRALAQAMRKAHDMSTPAYIPVGQWHLPYVTQDDRHAYSIEDCLKLSASCCAQVSFRALDQSMRKARAIYKTLAEAEPIHASPFEHQARAEVDADADGRNFKGWTQHRQLLEGTQLLEDKNERV